MKVIGSMILLGAVAGAVVLVVQLTSGRDPETGRTVWRPLSRIALGVGAVFGTSLIVAPILRATGLDPRGESSSEQFRADLDDAGFNESEIDCVEDRLVREHGSLEAAEDAADADLKVVLRPAFRCRDGRGLTEEMADCFAAGIAERLGVDTMGIDDLPVVAEAAGPVYMKAATAVSLVCIGATPAVADCIVEQLAVEYPDLFDRDVMPELTAEQQDFLDEVRSTCDAEG